MKYYFKRAAAFFAAVTMLSASLCGCSGNNELPADTTPVTTAEETVAATTPAPETEPPVTTAATEATTAAATTTTAVTTTEATTTVAETTAKPASPAISAASLSLVKGKTKTLSINNTDAGVSWESNNPFVATVSSSGKVTASACGTATIIAVADKKAYTCKITVTDASGNTGDMLELAIGERVAYSEGTKPDSNSVCFPFIEAQMGAECTGHPYGMYMITAGSYSGGLKVVSAELSLNLSEQSCSVKYVLKGSQEITGQIYNGEVYDDIVREYYHSTHFSGSFKAQIGVPFEEYFYDRSYLESLGAKSDKLWISSYNSDITYSDSASAAMDKYKSIMANESSGDVFKFTITDVAFEHTIGMSLSLERYTISDIKYIG